MAVKLILFIILAIAAFYLSQQSLVQVATPELKQQTLKPEIILPSPLEFPNLRWNHMPLSVYIDSSTAEKSSYASDVRLALEEWDEVANGVISFEITNSRDADITVAWVEKLKTESLDAAGNTDIKFYNQTNYKIITKADIQLLNRFESRELNDFDMANLGIHEIGHALGLSHSDVEDSIMNPILKLPSKEVKAITRQEIELLLDAYRIKPKPDLYITPNSTVSKIDVKILLQERYYINATITMENRGLVDSMNTTMQIKADGLVVKEDKLPEIPIGAVFTRTYINLPVEKNFSTVEIVLDVANVVDEFDEKNNILVLKV